MSDEKKPLSREDTYPPHYADIRKTLQQALMQLDHAELVVAAAYVEHAIEALDESCLKAPVSGKKH